MQHGDGLTLVWLVRDWPAIFEKADALAWVAAFWQRVGFDDPADAAAAVGAGGRTFGEVFAEGHFMGGAVGVELFVGQADEDALAVRVAVEQGGEVLPLGGEESDGEFAAVDAVDPCGEAALFGAGVVRGALLPGG